MRSKEIQTCVDLFYTLGRKEKYSLIENSNLTDKEMEVFKLKFIEGMYNQDIADKLDLSLDAYNKMQKQICIKFYVWICLKAKSLNANIDSLIHPKY